jgi:hypothetical protein
MNPINIQEWKTAKKNKKELEEFHDRIARIRASMEQISIMMALSKEEERKMRKGHE